MSKFTGLFTVVFSLVLITTAVAQYDWPHWRGPNYNGISSETNWKLQGPKIAWTAKVGSGFSSVSIAEGKLYTQGNSGVKKTSKNDKDIISCLDAKTGKEIWTFSYPQPLDPKYYEGGTSASPTIDGDRLYTFSKKGDLYCLNAKTSKEIWSKNLAKEIGAKTPTWGFAGSPFIYGKLLIMNCGSFGTALDKMSGKIIWKTGKDAAGYATPVPFEIKDQTLLAVMGKNAVAAVVPESGKVLWDYGWKTKNDINAADPIIAGNKMFISSGYNHGGSVIVFNAKGAEKVWENKNMRNQMNASVLVDGNLYGFDESTLKCIDFTTGSEKWEKDRLGKGTLMATTDGRLIILSEKGLLVTAKTTPEGYKPIAQAQVLETRKCWTVPVLSNGMIYCRDYLGNLVAVDVSL